MEKIKWIFVVYAVLAASSIMGIGISIGEKSILGAVVSIILVVFIMGMGFKTKAKMRANGEL